MAHFLKDQPFFTPNFLLWLDRFTGIWQHEEVRVEIDRRNDGGLMARNSNSERLPLINFVSGDWSKVEPPPGPLGMRPVMLSRSLLNLWLEPEVADKYAYAMFVSSGPKILLEKIETVINQTPLELRERKWLTWWKHHAEKAPEEMSSNDLRMHLYLFSRFQSEQVNSSSGGAPADADEPC